MQPDLMLTPIKQIPIESKQLQVSIEQNNCKNKQIIKQPVKNTTKNTGGTERGLEIFSILDHLGFKDEYEIRSIRLKNRNIQEWINRVPPTKPKFIVSLYNQRPDTIGSYDLMCASIKCTTSDFKKPHAICGYMCHGNPYIIDPNFLVPYPCRWWNYKELEHVLRTDISVPYKYVYTLFTISYSVYARRSYVSRIHPACLRRYKKTHWFDTPANVSMIKRTAQPKSLLSRLFFKTPKIRTPSPSKNLPNINSISPSKKLKSRGLKRKTLK